MTTNVQLPPFSFHDSNFPNTPRKSWYRKRIHMIEENILLELFYGTDLPIWQISLDCLLCTLTRSRFFLNVCPPTSFKFELINFYHQQPLQFPAQQLSANGTTCLPKKKTAALPKACTSSQNPLSRFGSVPLQHGR